MIDMIEIYFIDDIFIFKKLPCRICIKKNNPNIPLKQILLLILFMIS